MTIMFSGPPGSNSVAIGGNVSGGTTGSVLFVGSGPVLAQNNANFFWDNTLNRLGLGNAAPGTTLDITGTFRVSGNSTFSGLTANSFIFSGTAGLLTSTSAPTNGQLLIGSTGAAPVVAALTAGTGITVGTGAGSITINSAHALLSASHTDTTAASVVRGDLVIGQGVTPTWQRLALGVAARVLRSDGTDATWAQVVLTTDVTGILPSANGGTNNAFFAVSGPATSVKTFTFPNANETVATLGQTQTFTGAKTFNSSTFLLAGSSSGTTTINATAVASGTITIPAATDTLVGKATTDTFTNKTFNTAGAGNVFQINSTNITAVTGSGNAVLDTSPTIATLIVSGLASITSSQSPSNGSEIRFNGNVLTTGGGIFGTRQSFGTPFIAYNAYQNTSGTDSWTQANTGAGVGSSLISVGSLSGSAWFAVYGTGDNTATATFATFWGNPVFRIVKTTGRVGILTGASDPTSFLDMAAATTAAASARIPAGTAPTTPNEGDLWNDSTQKSVISFIDGINTKMSGTVFSATADAAVANTVTETSILGTGIGTKTLPTNFFVAGKTIRVTIRGYYGTTLTPTLNIKVKLGTTVVMSTGAQTQASSVTNQFFEASALITCRTTGATGTVFGQGFFQTSSTAVLANLDEMVNTATTTVDTTATQAVDVTATWGTANASNTITGTNVLIEVLN